MKDVHIDKNKLLEKVRENAEKHREVFLKAQEGFRKLAIERLDMMLEDARAGKPIVTTLGLTPPESHENDYARVIDMLEMSVDEVIVLSSNDFDRYVRDRWEWSQFFESVSASYTQQF